MGMAVPKRPLDEASSNHRYKKAKTANKGAKAEIPSALVADEVDFPRGGGTVFTPLEVKAIRAEAAKEADEALFKVCIAQLSWTRTQGSLQETKEEKGHKKKSKNAAKKESTRSSERSELPRIEHLNYKVSSASVFQCKSIISCVY